MQNTNPFIDLETAPVDPADLGHYLTEALRPKVADPKSLHAVVADALCISENAVYKKLKGINQFTGHELIQLAHRFGISLDRFAHGGPGRISFEFKPLVEPYLGPLDFLRNLRDNLKAALQIPDARLYYAASELQIFHYFYFPELTAFKLYVFSRSSWKQAPDQPGWTPEALQAHPVVKSLCSELIDLYDRVNSIEYWSSHFLANTLNQIEYYAFNEPDAKPYYRRLSEQVIELIHYQKLMAEYGRKCPPGGVPGPNSGLFDLFHNETMHTSNTYLVDSPSVRVVYAVFDNPNAFKTTDAAFSAYTADWLGRLAEKAVPLSRHNEKMRTHYFAGLLQRAAELRDRL